ncbi:MAG: XisI protein [Saprospiraceae bacterium]
MDKVAAYKKIARSVVESLGRMVKPTFDGIETEVITDDEKGHYLLFMVGWHNRQWHYASLLHIDIKSDGKVWLQHDGTDLVIAEELVEKGIPKHDIVLAYKTPSAREMMTEWGMAA